MLKGHFIVIMYLGLLHPLTIFISLAKTLKVRGSENMLAFLIRNLKYVFVTHHMLYFFRQS